MKVNKGVSALLFLAVVVVWGLVIWKVITALSNPAPVSPAIGGAGRQRSFRKKRRPCCSITAILFWEEPLPFPPPHRQVPGKKSRAYRLCNRIHLLLSGIRGLSAGNAKSGC